MKLFLKLNAIASTCLVLLGSSTAFAAQTASLSISGSGSYAVGSSFTVVVSENSGSQEVNGVDVRLSYNPSVLQVMSVSPGDFATCPAAPSASGGTITISCAALGSKMTGSHTVGVIGFKAIASGTATVSTLSNSAIVDANDSTPENRNDWNRVITSGTYNLVTPVSPQPQSNQGGTTTQANKTTSAPSSTKTTSGSNTQNPTGTDQSNNIAANSDDSTPATKGATDKAATANGEQAAGYNPTVAIILAVLVALVGAAAIYARRNPRQFAAATSAVALAVGSAKNATLSVFKKAEAKPVAKKSATKAVIAKKPATKKKATAKKTPVKKAKVHKKS